MLEREIIAVCSQIHTKHIVSNDVSHYSCVFQITYFEKEQVIFMHLWRTG